MKIFGTNDTIFARATMMGREIVNIRLNGISSMQALMNCIRQILGDVIGMISLNIRNISQGWAHTSAYVLR